MACAYCNASFFSLNRLQKHERSHKKKIKVLEAKSTSSENSFSEKRTNKKEKESEDSSYNKQNLETLEENKAENSIFSEEQNMDSFNIMNEEDVMADKEEESENGKNFILNHLFDFKENEMGFNLVQPNDKDTSYYYFIKNNNFNNLLMLNNSILCNYGEIKQDKSINLQNQRMEYDYFLNNSNISNNNYNKAVNNCLNNTLFRPQSYDGLY